MLAADAAHPDTNTVPVPAAVLSMAAVVVPITRVKPYRVLLLDLVL